MGSRQRITDLTPFVRGGGAGRPGSQQQRALTARARVAIAPGAANESMTVVAENLTLRHGFAIPAGHWEPRRDVELPKVGDLCLLVFDDVGDVWVPTWSPY